VVFPALGCPDVTAPPGAWLQRSGDHIVIKCNDTLETWFLTCQRNRWIGDFTNCTAINSKSTQGLNWGDPAGSQIRHLLLEIHYL